MKRYTTAAFTLIEMLTVIVIIGVILAIAIPAATTLMKSGGLQSASRQLSTTMSLARQNAITQRTRTNVQFPFRFRRLVVVDSQSIISCPPEMYNSTVTTTLGPWQFSPKRNSYAAYRYSRDASAYSQIGKFEILPVGVVIDHDSSSMLVIITTNLDSSTTSPVMGDFGICSNIVVSKTITNIYSITDYDYVRFDPTGAAGHNGFVRLAEGFVNYSASTTIVTGVNHADVYFDNLVGRIKVTNP